MELMREEIAEEELEMALATELPEEAAEAAADEED